MCVCVCVCMCVCVFRSPNKCDKLHFMHTHKHTHTHTHIYIYIYIYTARNGKRNVIWFNPHYIKNVKANTSKDLIKLIEKHLTK